MEREAERKFPKVGAITVLVVLALIAYSVRLILSDTEDAGSRAAELCRSIVPALHLAPKMPEIISTEVEDGGAVVRVFYRIDVNGGSARRRWVMCDFDLTTGLFGEPQLEAVETDTGRLGDGRLFVIKRWWLEDHEIIRNFGDERGTLEIGPA